MLPLLAVVPFADLHDVFNRIIDYAEHFDVERCDDAKCIQKMMLILFSRVCSEEQFLRIGRIEEYILQKSLSPPVNKDAPPGPVALTSGNDSAKPQGRDALVNALLAIFFGSEENVHSFLNRIRGMTTDRDICKYIKAQVRKRIISETSYKKDLWQILHDNGVFKTSYSNYFKYIH